MPVEMYTPWGKARLQRQLSEGILWVETSDHGGLLIEKMVAQHFLSLQARSIGCIWDNFFAFEQEKAIVVVFYEHPELYDWMEEELTRKFAEDILRFYYPDYFALERLEREESPVERV